MVKKISCSLLLKFRILPFVCVFLGLTACGAPMRPVPAPTATTTGALIGAAGGAVIGSQLAVGGPVGAVMGGVVGAAIGNYIGKQTTLVKQIEDSGVPIYFVGDSVMLVLPTDQFFMEDSPAFNTYSYPTLDKIALLLRHIEKVGVKIAGYTDNRGTPARNQALSEQRAQNVARYLWKRGIDARLLYSVGYGCCDSIATNATSAGRKANRRIEITFFRLPGAQPSFEDGVPSRCTK
jgi:outer membrane protein OmpA-like peptidoglycan-associated protein